MSFPKGQSSVEFLSIVGIALLISAPIILEAQERMIGIELTDEDAGLQDSIFDISQAIREVSSQDRYSKRTEQFRLGDDISSIEVVEDRVLKVSQNRSGELTYYTRQFDTDIEIQRIPKKEGLHELEVEFLGSKVVVEGDAERQSILQQVFSAVDSADWNQGIFSGTSADRNDNSGDLALGYLNGTNPSATELEEGLIGYWRMDGDSGSVVDYSGNGNDGITRNFDGDERGVNGAFGTKAFEFDGSKQYVDVGPHSYRNFTVSFWAKFDGPVNGDESDMVLSNGNIQSKTDFVQLSTPDTNGFGLRVAIGGDSERITWNRIEETGVSKKLTFFTITKEGKTIEAFYNGTSQGKKTLSSDYKFSIGAIGLGWADNERYSFNGKLDEVKIYNRSLSASEVSQLYLNGRPFTGKYTSKVIDNSESQNWSELEVDASVPSDTSLTATFQTLQDSLLYTSEQSYKSLNEWRQGDFNKTTADEAVTEYIYPSESKASTQSEFNQGSFNGTSADRKDNSGDLGLGYRNGSAGDDLVGYWRLDKESGSVIDYSGSGNDGSTQNFDGDERGADGTFGSQALELTTNDYVEVGSNNDYSFGDGSKDQPFSVSAWVWQNGSDKRVVPFSKMDGPPSSWFGGFWIRDTSPNDLMFRLYDGGGGNTLYKTVDWDNQRNWSHIVATYDGGADFDGIDIYIDGNLGTVDETDKSSYNGANTGDSKAYIGAHAVNSQYERSTDGKIDEVRIYNRSLSQSEVEDLYFNGRPFQGNYTAKEIDNGQETDWDSLEVNASIPSDTSVNATFKALDTNGSLVDSQDVDLNDSLHNYSLDVSNSEDAEVFINGASSNVTKSWEVHSLEVFSREVEEKNEGLRIGYQNGSAGDDLVGYWRLDKNISGDGGVLRDYSGNGNYGITREGVRVGREGIFASSSTDYEGESYTEVSNTGNLEGMEDLTFGGWVNPDSLGKNDVVIGGKRLYEIVLDDGNSQCNPGQNFWWALDNGDGDWAVNCEDLTISEDKWTHLMVVSDSSKDQIRIYVNGSLEATNSGTGTINQNGNNVAIGRRGDKFGNFDGKIDEVRIYDRSLSDSEVEDLYFNGMPYRGNFTAEKIDKAQEVSWERVEINASVPSDTNLTAEFKALDSSDNVVSREYISVDSGSNNKNYSLSVQASESARLRFNGTSGNVTKTWKVYDYEVFSGERQVDESESFIVQDGLNEFSLGVNDSRDARIRLNGTTSDVTQSWSVSNMSVFTE